MYLPRINQEVIVDFLDGDPDRPIIIGCLYHAINMPPYPLPDEKTKSYIMSNTSKGGGGHNEIRFEDKEGKQEIYVHTPYQHQLHLSDPKHSVTMSTGGGQTVNMVDIKDGGRIRMNTANGHAVLMQKDGGVSCVQIFTQKNHVVTLDDANDAVNITDRSAALSIDMNSSKGQIKIQNAASGGGWILLECPQGKISTKAKDLEGYGTVSSLTKAPKVEVVADATLSLKCGGSSIELTPAMITIKSPMVKIN
jgi:type VI secretion system secreted protein VgrG